MKKKGLSVILCTSLMVCMLTACGDKGESKKNNIAITDIETQEITKEQTIYKLSKEINVYANGTERLNNKYVYDSNGNLIEKNDEKFNWYEYKYDTNGKLYKETYAEGLSDEKDDIDKMTLYEYDVDGNLSKEVGYKGNGDYVLYVREYNSYGEIELESGDYYETENDYIYDSNHNMIMMTMNLKDGKCLKKIEYEYDLNGNIIKMIETGIKDRNSKYEYKYEYENTYEYDESGKLVRENERRYSKGSLNSKGTKPFDNFYTYEYEYDENGNLFKKVITDSNDEDRIGSYIRYEYEIFTEE